MTAQCGSGRILITRVAEELRRRQSSARHDRLLALKGRHRLGLGRLARAARKLSEFRNLAFVANSRGYV